MSGLQKNVDLSKDDLLGDILEDLHSEVRRLMLNPLTAFNVLLSCLKRALGGVKKKKKKMASFF